MAFRTEQFKTAEELDFFLNGGVSSGRAVASADNKGRIVGLDGLTLVINATTVTFSDPNQEGLTPAQIKTQIETPVAGLLVQWRDRKIRFSHASGVTVADNGTANSIFGFPDDGDIVGTVFNAFDGVAPRLVSVGAAPASDSFYALVELA